jgi:hypothetical protein
MMDDDARHVCPSLTLCRVGPCREPLSDNADGQRTSQRATQRNADGTVTRSAHQRTVGQFLRPLARLPDGASLPGAARYRYGACKSWAVSEGGIMASETQDWVEDVRRWYFSGAAEAPNTSSALPSADEAELGYEAAQPALMVRNWPDREGQ